MDASSTPLAPLARSQQGAPTTDAERRIIAFLKASGATGPAKLPDWLLGLLEGDAREAPSHELIIVASLLYIRRLRPGISLEAALALLCGYASDPGRLADLSDRIAAFRLSCCFERLKRAGRLEEVSIDDPFDPEGVVSVTLTEQGWRPVDAAPPARGTARGCPDFGRN